MFAHEAGVALRHIHPKRKRIMNLVRSVLLGSLAPVATIAITVLPANAQQTPKKPNIVVLMSDDTGRAGPGACLGGAALGHPTPGLDQLAKEGAMFADLVWPGQLHCSDPQLPDASHI